MLVLPQGCLRRPQLGQPFEDGAVFAHLGAKRQRVDEETDHLVGAVNGRMPARSGDAEEHIAVSGVAIQEQRPRGRHESAQRALGRPRERLEDLRFVFGEIELHPAQAGSASASNGSDKRRRRFEPGQPALPGNGEAIFSTVLTVSGADGSMRNGDNTWFYVLKQQADGQWRLVGGGSGP